MKILHTSDWHLGKRLHGASLIEDQREALWDLIAQIAGQRPDAILIAGDIYDRSVPPVEAVLLADSFFVKLREVTQCPVFIIGGNHDSPERLGFGRGLMARAGFYVATQFEDALKPIEIVLQGQKVQCFLMPFLEPLVVKGTLALKEEAYDFPTTQQGLFDYMKTQWQKNFDPQAVKLLVAHTFFGLEAESPIEAIEESESERPLSIGGHDRVDVKAVEGFDYVALGHLHRPQKVGREAVRYSGALLKYAFSESVQPKGVTWITINPGGPEPITWEQTSLDHSRDLRVIRGTLETLLERPTGNLQDYILAILEDEGALHEPMRRLRGVYPNCLKLTRDIFALEGQAETQGQEVAGSKLVLVPSPEGVFEQFYEHVKGQAPTQVERDHFANKLKAFWQEVTP